MKRVTKNNLIKLIQMKKQYEITLKEDLKQQINNFINNVINKDKRYFSKLTSYNFNNDELKYLM